MARIIEKINEGWDFEKQGEIIDINLPHTWNAQDGQTGPDMYYRGICTYRRQLKKPYLAGGQQVYIEFRGVNSSAVVRMNGKELTRHDGGYSTFRVNVTDALKDENMLEVLVDNAPNDRVYPQRADFTFYGGIYRDVYLIVTDPSHFDLDYYGGNGVRITPEIDGENAVVHFETYSVGEAEKIVVSVAGAGETELTLETIDGKTYGKGSVALRGVHRWDGLEDPYLYEATAVLYRDGMAVDAVTDCFGCREFRFDAKEGFFLNGRRYPLHGVSRHQDRLGVGNALTREMHEEDMDIILSMGANSIRLAHYQHDQYFYNLCDEKGIVAWAEIPYITVHMDTGRENTITQMKELITQNYNHASIVCWALSNEISLQGVTEDLIENHRVLNDLVHEMDKTRVSAMANLFLLETDSPLVSLPDIRGYNLYYGWYVGDMEDNDAMISMRNTRILPSDSPSTARIPSSHYSRRSRKRVITRKATRLSTMSICWKCSRQDLICGERMCGTCLNSRPQEGMRRGIRARITRDLSPSIESRKRMPIISTRHGGARRSSFICAEADIMTGWRIRQRSKCIPTWKRLRCMWTIPYLPGRKDRMYSGSRCRFAAYTE